MTIPDLSKGATREDVHAEAAKAHERVAGTDDDILLAALHIFTRDYHSAFGCPSRAGSHSERDFSAVCAHLYVLAVDLEKQRKKEH